MSLSNCFGPLAFLVVFFQLATTTPTWYTASDGNSYLIESDSKYNWLQAHDLCARQDLQLAVIDSAGKNAPFDALLRKVFANPIFLWLGHHDEFNKAKNARPFYAVSTGNKLNYGNWLPGEPNNSGNIEHCTHISSDFKWNDKDCQNPNYGYVCEKHPLTLEYIKDLEHKRQKTTQKNSQLSADYKDTQVEVQKVLENSYTATNNILSHFNNSLEEIMAESKNSIGDIVKKKPYLVAVIADVGDIIKEILEEAHKEILRASEESGESIRHVQVETDTSINNALDRFSSLLYTTSTEIDKILV